jgi:hypothetical protein
MKTIVEHVEERYKSSLPHLAESFSESDIRLDDSRDPVHGKVVIELETGDTVSVITFWNKGDVMVLAVDKHSRNDFVIDDRQLAPFENIGLLLDGCLEKIQGGTE